MPEVNVKVTEKDFGLDRVMKGLVSLNKDKSALYIGVKFPNRRYADGQTVGHVGLLHEFGSPGGKVPPKRWIRGTFERKKKRYFKILDEKLGRVVDRGGRASAKSLFLELGPIIGKDMKEAIKQFNLIDSGLLLRSVGWRVAKETKR